MLVVKKKVCTKSFVAKTQPTCFACFKPGMKKLHFSHLQSPQRFTQQSSTTCSAGSPKPRQLKRYFQSPESQCPPSAWSSSPSSLSSSQSVTNLLLEQYLHEVELAKQSRNSSSTLFPWLAECVTGIFTTTSTKKYGGEKCD